MVWNPGVLEPPKITTIFQFCRLNGNYLVHMYQLIENSYNLCLLMYIIVVNTRPFENQHCKYH